MTSGFDSQGSGRSVAQRRGAAARSSRGRSSRTMAGISSVEYGAPGYEQAIADALRRDGAVAVAGVLDAAECEDRMSQLVESLRTLNPGLAGHRWRPEQVPAGPRDGLFQSLVGQLPAVWAVRTHPRVRAAFTAAYSGLRGRPIHDFVASADGINLRPPGAQGGDRSRGPRRSVRIGGGDEGQTRGKTLNC